MEPISKEGESGVKEWCERKGTGEEGEQERGTQEERERAAGVKSPSY